MFLERLAERLEMVRNESDLDTQIDQMTAVSVTEPAHSGDTVTEFQDSLQKVRSTMFGLRDALEATLANPSQTSN